MMFVIMGRFPCCLCVGGVVLDCKKRSVFIECVSVCRVPEKDCCVVDVILVMIFDVSLIVFLNACRVW